MPEEDLNIHLKKLLEDMKEDMTLLEKIDLNRYRNKVIIYNKNLYYCYGEILKGAYMNIHGDKYWEIGLALRSNLKGGADAGSMILPLVALLEPVVEVIGEFKTKYYITRPGG